VKEGKTFDQARRLLRQHYQHIVIHDFLMRVADPAIVDRILRQGNRVYNPPTGQFFLPLEFAVAAYRFGHSMVRDAYDFNLNFKQGRRRRHGQAPLSVLFALHAFNVVVASAAAQETATFARLLDYRVAPVRQHPRHESQQQGRKIDTKLAGGLFRLADSTDRHCRATGAAWRSVTLLRGYRMRMPTGQAVARRLGVPVLTPTRSSRPLRA